MPGRGIILFPPPFKILPGKGIIIITPWKILPGRANIIPLENIARETPQNKEETNPVFEGFPLFFGGISALRRFRVEAFL